MTEVKMKSATGLLFRAGMAAVALMLFSVQAAPVDENLFHNASAAHMWLPTELLEQRADACTAATPITCGQTFYSSTIGMSGGDVTVDTYVDAWYTVVGENKLVTLSTCNSATNFDTFIMVFTGSCGNGLLGTTFNDDDGTCPLSSVSSSVSFVAELNKVYKVRIYGYNGAAGSFGLSMSCTEFSGNPDSCAAPTTLTCGSSMHGSLNYATGGDSADSVTDSYADQWFVITGGTLPITVSTCDGFTDADTILTVYKGSCDALVQVMQNNNAEDACPGNSHASSVTWTPVNGMTYRIRLHGTVGSTGSYVISANCAYHPDLCTAPQELKCGTTVFGNLLNATTEDPAFPEDGFIDEWYAFNGLGSTVTISTCNTFTNFDVALQAFTGSNCALLSQIAYSDNNALCRIPPANNLNALVSWVAQAGIKYRVRVRGLLDHLGDYALTVTCGAPATPSPSPTPTRPPVVTPTIAPSPKPTYSSGISDTCAAAKQMFCGSTVYATLATATSADPDSLNDNYRDHFYYINGPNRRVTATTCHGFTTVNTVIHIYQGLCSSLSQVAWNDNSAQCITAPLFGQNPLVTFSGYLGQQYRIRVRPYSNSVVGNYTLRVICGAALT
mmetsp:Transcript_1739/g.2978  ORF Transcript_1739/g.2978 Transcript_1739/m.2978 type:complete len:614 (+) Transcript_1739:466-2307(+)